MDLKDKRIMLTGASGGIGQALAHALAAKGAKLYLVGRHDALEKEAVRRWLGWPEKFFVKLNALLPSLVDGAIIRQLPIIRRYARGKHK